MGEGKYNIFVKSKLGLCTNIKEDKRIWHSRLSDTS